MAREAVELAGEGRGQAADARHQGADVADLGRGAGGDHDAVSLAATHHGTGVGQIEAVADGRARRHPGHLLGHGHRFSGQRRFVDMQVADLEQTQIGGHPVAGFQQYQIAGYQFRRVDVVAFAIPHQGGAVGEQGAHRFQRLLRPSCTKLMTALTTTTPTITAASR